MVFRILYLSLLILFFGMIEKSWSTYSLYSEYFGSGYDDFFRDVKVVNDGGLMTVGGVSSFGTSESATGVFASILSTGRVDKFYRFGETYEHDRDCVANSFLPVFNPLSGEVESVIIEGKIKIDSDWFDSYILKISLVSESVEWQVSSDCVTHDSVGLVYDHGGLIFVNNETDILWVTYGRNGVDTKIRLVLLSVENGTIINQKSWVGSNGKAEIRQISKLSDDSGYLLTGCATFDTHGSGYRSFLLIKFDMDLNVIWARNYGIFNVHELAYASLELSDGSGFVSVGQRGMYMYNAHDLLVLRVDELGNVVYFKKLENMMSGSEYNAGFSVIGVHNDTDILIVGGQDRPFVCRFDPFVGEIVWSYYLQDNSGEIVPLSSTEDVFYSITEFEFPKTDFYPEKLHSYCCEDDIVVDGYVVVGMFDHRFLITYLNSSGMSCSQSMVSNQFVVSDYEGWKNGTMSDIQLEDDVVTVYDTLKRFDLLNDGLYWNDDVEYICFTCGDDFFGTGPSNDCFGRGNCSIIPSSSEDDDYYSSLTTCECFDEEVYTSSTFCKDKFMCFGVWFDSPDVCGGGGGKCVDVDECECFSGLFGSNCTEFGCFEFPRWDRTEVCSGKGNCTERNRCECDLGYYGVECNVTKCGDFFSNETDEVCGGPEVGSCVFENRTCNCSLNGDYSGSQCEFFSCFGVSRFDKNHVCNGHGECILYDTCECVNLVNYTSPECEFSCFGVSMNDEENVCSGHGSCVDHNNCSCISGSFSGGSCEYWKCYGISVFEVDRVCGGHGICIDEDFCLCFLGYESSVFLGECDLWKCGEYWRYDYSNVCNQRGVCNESNLCTCENSFEGSLCETWSCAGVDYRFEDTCNSRGKCLAPEHCDCQWGYAGNLCQTNMKYSTIMAPVLSVTGILFICFFCCLLIGFCILVCLSCVAGVLLCLSMVFGLLGVVMRQRQGIRKFGKLKNFDLLLREQELDEDDSIAHLRIDSSLFEIDFDEIHLECIIGEGGSCSIVYKAKWCDRDVAFTRSVCSDQLSFDEFEREVLILGSVSHPHVLQFYGCSLKPPRVGIVMEYCARGDLRRHVILHTQPEQKQNKMEISEKMRLATEIILPMEYLHSRNVIHRDLKLENVLLDDTLSCKLMDFGLSKIVERMSQVKTKAIGTSFYMAPEIVIGDGSYTEKVDVFAFGICFYILITQRSNPYDDDEKTMQLGLMGIEMRVASNPDFRPNLGRVDECMSHLFPNADNNWVKKVLERCWDCDIKVRPSFKELREIVNENWKGEKVERKEQLTNGVMEKKKKKKEDEDNMEDMMINRKLREMLKERDEEIKILQERIVSLENEMSKN